MTKKVLITGISGFAGRYLAKSFLQQNDIEIHGTHLTDLGNDDLKSEKSITFHQVNLLEKNEVETLIKTIAPTSIYHLAAVTSSAESFKDPVHTIMNNVTAQLNILEALKEYKLFETRMLIVSSGEVYGMVDQNHLPIDEETPFMPNTPYAVSKLTQDHLGLQYFLSYNLQIIRVRPLNHIGPFQSPQFVVPSFAKKIIEIERGLQKPKLFVGNLDAKRDFTDVLDIVAAYKLALEKGIPGEVYNIGSGVSYTIKEILDKLLSFSKVKIDIEVDESLLRPSDTKELICDASKFKKLTGWSPKIPLDESLKQTLDYWRNIA